jgi:diacylglycerol kinase (ATP)
MIIGLFILFILIIVGKGLGKHGQVLKGGLVSGHAAFAFFFAGVVTMLTGKLIPSLLAVLLAAMVAQSRYESKIHSVLELSLGALLGSGLAFVLFGLAPQ